MVVASIHGADSYKNLLKQLLPEGPAWECEEILSLVESLAQEMARSDQRIYQLLTEMDPAGVYELVPDWEQVMNLPDPCLGPSPSYSDRVKQVRKRLTQVGAQTPAFFVSIAKEQGYDKAKVVEIWAPRFGRSRFGKARFGTWLQQFFWILDTGSRLDIGRVFGASYFGQRFGQIAGDALECVISRYSPAHTVYVIQYPEGAVTYGLSQKR